MSEQQRRDSFVVRIWWESDGERDYWRGWVQHTAAGVTRCFQCLEDLLAFIDLQAGPFGGLSTERQGSDALWGRLCPDD